MKVGSLCSGYSGLELGLSELFDVDLAWVSDIDKGANKILAHRHPDVPNLGDFTTARDVEPVDVLTAGFPCQPVSHAGKRAGTDDERWLFDDITRLVGLLDPRPRLLVFENVLGLLSANRGHAMARVVHGLAQIGYVGRWRTLRAADVGAPHRRERVFIIAWDAASRRQWGGIVGVDRGRRVEGQARAADRAPGDTDRSARSERREPASVEAEGGRARPDAGGSGGALLPTPRATDGTKGGPNQRGSSGDLMLPSAVMELLPTPRATRGGSATETVELLLAIEAQRLLPTPGAIDGNGGPKRIREDGRTEADHGPALRDLASSDRWGDYAPAIARWEAVIGRPAPAPTETGPKGSPRLSPVFVEFLMGLPEGWVTDVPGLTRNEQLKALGNGVVPQQAAAAVGWLLDVETRERVSA